MKTHLYSNRPMDLNLLTDSEFEEIVYHYFNEQIKNNLFIGIYDKAELSVGVGEGGADTKLYFKNKVVGCVQCKKHYRNVSGNIIFSDIIKFLLNHIVECQNNSKKSSSFIHSIDNFTYYIVVAKDITQNAKTLINDFNNAWGTLDLNKTFDQLKSKYSGLKHLEFNQTKPLLQNLLNKLKVQALNSVDLENVIRNKVDILQRFYAVEKVIDEDSIKKIGDYIRKTQDEKSYNIDDIQQIAIETSASISNVKNHFGSKPSSTVERIITNEIYHWIKKPQNNNESNIAVISGNAGLGKSVIMLQLYNKLINSGIPTICLKADRLAFNSIDELGREIGLKSDFFHYMDQFVLIGSEVVLMIDQIDALSQTLSNNLKPLAMYDRIIRRYTKHNNIKIIVSCRTYDLNYDPIINGYSGKQNFIIPPLEINQVIKVVHENTGLREANLNEKLVELLTIPLHLDVFIKVYSDELEISAIKSIQDLYSELWKLKVNNNKSVLSLMLNHEKIVELIFEIALKMYEKQSINILEDLFSDTYPKELEYLSSEGIIIRKNGRIEFFHQTFFDYCIARNFVLSEKDLIEDIKNRHQGLFLRSKIQQIFSYQRGTNPTKYAEDLKKMLCDQNIRFHLKLLVLQQLALNDNVLIQERKLIEEIYVSNKEYMNIFTALYHGDQWLNIFINNKWIQQFTESTSFEDIEIIRAFLRRYSRTKSSELLTFLSNHQHLKEFNILIQDFLFSNRDYDDLRYMELLRHLIINEGELNLGFTLYIMLEKGIKNFPEQVIDILLSLVKIDDKEVKAGEDNYFPGQRYNKEIYQKLWDEYPDLAYILIKKIINSILDKRIAQRSNNLDKAKVDTAFLLYNKNGEQVFFHHMQLSKLQDFLINKNLTNHNYVKSEISEYLNSNLIVHLIIAFSVIMNHPKKFVEESFQFFKNNEGINRIIGINSYLNFLIQKSFGESYPYFTDTQRACINSTLLNLYPKHELQVIEYEDGKKLKSKYFGETQYNFLVAIPSIFRNKYSALKKAHSEFQRKFGNRDAIIEPQGMKVTMGYTVLPTDAYDKMNFDDWKNSFKSYSKENITYDSWHDPDEYSHGVEFRKKVSENPKHFINFVEEIIHDPEIPKSYKVKGLEGLKDGLLDPEELIIKFVDTIKSNEFNDEQLKQLIWITECFSNSRIVNDDVINFLKEKCLNGNELNRNSDEPLIAGINTVRGAAVSMLMNYHFSDEKRKEIYSTLKLIAINSSAETRACILYKFPNFLQYNENDEVLATFYLIINDYSPGLVQLSVNLLTYLINSKFEELIPFLKKGIYIENSFKSIGHLITKAYCFEYFGSKELIEEYWSQGEKYIETSVEIAWQFIKGDSQVENATVIVTKFLDSKSTQIANAYIFPFFDLKPEQFERLYSFLNSFVLSEVGKHRQDSFYKYLLRCTNDFPQECIELASHFENHLFDKHKDRVLRNEPLQVIIQAYNALREYDNGNPLNERAMDCFDLILTKTEFRNSAFDVLSKVDLY